MRFTTDESKVYKSLTTAIKAGDTANVQLIHSAIVDSLGLKGKKADKVLLAEKIFEIVGEVNMAKHKEGRQAADHFGDQLISKTTIMVDEEEVLIKVGSLRGVVVWHQTHYQCKNGGRQEARRQKAQEGLERARGLMSGDEISIKDSVAALAKLAKVNLAVTLSGMAEKGIEKLAKKLDK